MPCLEPAGTLPSSLMYVTLGIWDLRNVRKNIAMDRKGSESKYQNALITNFSLG